jgi:hypothetical protein
VLYSLAMNRLGVVALALALTGCAGTGNYHGAAGVMDDACNVAAVAPGLIAAGVCAVATPFTLYEDAALGQGLFRATPSKAPVITQQCPGTSVWTGSGCTSR